MVHFFYLLTGKLEPYLSNRVGRTMSGLIRAKFWRAPAASKLPLLLNTASMTAGLRHSTNAVRSSSFNLDSSGMGVSQDFFGNLSLMKKKRTQLCCSAEYSVSKTAIKLSQGLIQLQQLCMYSVHCTCKSSMCKQYGCTCRVISDHGLRQVQKGFTWQQGMYTHKKEILRLLQELQNSLRVHIQYSDNIGKTDTYMYMMIVS